MSVRSSSKVLVLVWMSVSALAITAPALAEIYSFQQGTNGYDRAQDTEIRWAFTTKFGETAEWARGNSGDASAYELYSTNGGRQSVLEVGHFFHRVHGSIGGGRSTLEAGPTYRYSRFFIRFRDVFGTGPGQVPTDIAIKRATLKMYNTEDNGTKVATGGAYFGDTITVVGPGDVETREPNLVAQPKLNAGTIAIYPALTKISYGFDDGVATKGRVTADFKRRGKEMWAQTCSSARSPNDPIGIAFDCGPSDVGDPDIADGREAEIDSNHPGFVEVFQDATSGFKEFDVTGLIDFITGNGVYVAAYSPPSELPTLDINYGNAYRSSEWGDTYDKDANLLTAGSPEDVATRPMLVITLVPEPATAALIVFGSMLMLRRRR